MTEQSSCPAKDAPSVPAEPERLSPESYADLQRKLTLLANQLIELTRAVANLTLAVSSLMQQVQALLEANANDEGMGKYDTLS